MRLFMSYGCPSEGLKAQMFSRLFMSIRSGFSVCVRSTFTPNFERKYKAWLSHPRICVSFHSLYFSSLITLHMPCRSEEHTSELQSRENLVCRLLLEKK